MSARSKFHALLKAANFGDSIREDIVAEILDEHAHELAEKVRSYDRLTMRMSGHVMAPLAQVANFIDPEVE